MTTIYSPKDQIKTGVFDAPNPVDKRPSSATAIQPTHKLAELKDVTFYSLGPIYEYIGVPFDLIAQFLEDTKIKTDVTAYVVNYELFVGLTDWCNTIYAMPNDVAKLFTRWAVTQVFNKTDEGVTWQVRGREIPIIDPGAMHIKKLDDVRYIKCIIFLPYSNTTVIDTGPNDKVGISYRLFRKPPGSDDLPDFDLTKLKSEASK